jgi:hypothetical protein
MRNNKTVPVEGVSMTGWGGLANGKIYLRPDRGSGGFALYDSAEQARRFTGCDEVVELYLRLKQAE